MAIDPSIFARFMPQAKSVADYDREHMEGQAAQQMNALRALQLQAGQRQESDAAAASQRGNALRGLVGGFGADDDANALALLRGGFLKEGQDYREASVERKKKAAEGDRAAAQADKERIGTGLQRLEIVGQLMAGVRDQATYEQAKQVAAQQFGPEFAARIPAQYDPAVIAQAQQQAMSVKERLEQEWKAKGYDLDVRKQGEVERANVTRERQTAANDIMTPDGKGGFITNRPLIGAKASIAKAGATSVSVNATQEKEESKAVGKFLGEQYADIQKAGIGAQTKLDRAGRMEQLLEKINTGKFEGAKKEAAAVGQAFGITIDPNLGDKEAFEALSNQLALEARNPSGGAGMPGAMSDKDREFLVQITPNLTKTPDGNRKIIETAKKLAKRDADVARLAREYRNKSGTLDEGFFEELRQYSNANPLFADKPAGAPKAGAVMDGYRFKGGNPADQKNWEKL
jgi:hypothetical protein